jgi:hypothetical protein
MHNESSECEDDEEVKGENDEFDFGKTSNKTKFEKCKDVGRIGKQITRLDFDNAYGDFKQFGYDGCDIESKS